MAPATPASLLFWACVIFGSCEGGEDVASVSPCRDFDDFLPDEILREFCIVPSRVDNVTCKGHGCIVSNDLGSWSCSCDREASCLALGGRWNRQTCAQELTMRVEDLAWLEALKFALERGGPGCSEMTLRGEKLEDLIHEQSRKCCASFPANACYQDARKMSPCRNEEDFLPEKMMSESQSCGAIVYDWSPSVHRSIANDCLGYDRHSTGRTCCVRDPVCETPYIYFEVLGSLLLGLGGMGILFATWRLRLPQGALPLEASDKELLKTGLRGDGAALHEKVPKENWCVSRDDLRQFRRLVMNAVAQGSIRPTDRDPFEPSDLTIGPSVYTITDQFIKPMSQRAGNMSWALLKNPNGLRCDVFVTHCWAEGIYEFLDRVEHSWPGGARGAYACFLSNPQNLDIASLISSPSMSPFAVALRVASDVLVLPNHAVSIYARLWCVYEAFLAYSWQKNIRTATRHHQRWSRIARIMCLCLAATGAAVLLTFGDGFGPRLLLSGGVAFGLLVTNGILMRRGFHGASLQACNAFLCAAGSWTLSAFLLLPLQETIPRPATSAAPAAWICFLAFCCGAEVDRMATVDGSLRSLFLARSFSGRLLEAECSSLDDKAKIHEELLKSGKAQDVEQAVQDLVRMNTFSLELRRAADLAGPLGDMSYFGWRWVILGIFVWCCFPVMYMMGEAWSQAHVFGIPMVIQGVLWLLIFCTSAADRQCFSSATLPIWLCTSPLLFLGQLIGVDTFVVFFGLGSLLLGPFCLCLLLAGPHRMARVPVVGPRLVQLCIGHGLTFNFQQPGASGALAPPADVVIKDATISV
ncbi:unnamed protein product [Symbiodinium sp. CCMP2592]|nr:unnamed protein product [Symbiodinium sp. CCMP2592]